MLNVSYFDRYRKKQKSRNLFSQFHLFQVSKNKPINQKNQNLFEHFLDNIFELILPKLSLK